MNASANATTPTSSAFPTWAGVVILLTILVLAASAGGWAGEFGFWSLVIIAIGLAASYGSGKFQVGSLSWD